MELLNYILPREVVSKVRLYHSHPVADIVREERANHAFDETRTSFANEYFDWHNFLINEKEFCEGMRRSEMMYEFWRSRKEKWYHRLCEDCYQPILECLCPNEELDLHCDCSELWDDCQCWCHNCGDEYKTCRNDCYHAPEMVSPLY